MKVKDVSDRVALEACWGYGKPDNRGGAIQVLQRDHDIPFKVALRKLEQLDRRGLIEYGVSLNFPWRTPEGEDELARLQESRMRHLRDTFTPRTTKAP